MVNTIFQRLTNKVDRIQLERLVLPYLTRLKDENVIDSVIFEILPRVVVASCSALMTQGLLFQSEAT